ncbi:MAG: hypothetical protein JXA18_02555 [Chitinispirillaceae bacterium]|nr:hypothetical protein [Chitinispirillaceae bacterium]
MKRDDAGDTVNCPYCGETIPRNAAACPQCGSDERTGWSEGTYLDGIDLGDNVDYEVLHRNEFSSGHRTRVPLGRIITAAVLLLIFIAALLRSLI